MHEEKHIGRNEDLQALRASKTMKHQPISADTNLIIFNVWLAVLIASLELPLFCVIAIAVLNMGAAFWRMTEGQSIIAPESPVEPARK